MDGQEAEVAAGGTAATAEAPEFLTAQLITCLGNKRSLLPFLDGALQRVRARLGDRPLACADLFAGSGVVARALKRHCRLLVANDLEAYSRAANACHLTNRSAVDAGALAAAVAFVRERLAAAPLPGFFAELYAPRDDARIRRGERAFYTRANAIRLDTARAAIGELAPALQTLLLGPLLAAASVHTNTAGVFKGFYKNARGIGQFGGRGREALSRIQAPIEVASPVLSRHECEVVVHQQDANALAAALPELDLAYLDPPYNQHPYGSNYFLLNLLVDHRRPTAVSKVAGIPPDWNRSAYNRRAAAGPALFALVERLPAKFVLLSYNSEGFVAPRELLAQLSRLGTVTHLTTPYATFRGSRNLRSRPLSVTESLYLLEK